MNPQAITADRVASILSSHLPVYRLRKPVYQTSMLASLSALWDPSHRKVLDVGGGTGVIAEAIKQLLPVDEVVSIDVEDRYLPSLDLTHSLYDGRHIPFGNASFDAAVINNVLHHVPVQARADLLVEVRRILGASPLYIKDHVATNIVDHGRLALLDVIGNVPFGGMVSARYLSMQDWRRLAVETGYRIEAQISGDYRQGLAALAFPNRLEVTMRWRPLVSASGAAAAPQG